MKTFARIPPPLPVPLPELPAFERFLIVLGHRVAPLEPRPETVEVLREASSLRLLPPQGLLVRPDAAAAHVLVVVKGTVRTFERVTVLPELLSKEQPKIVAGKGQASGKAPDKGPGKGGGKGQANPASAGKGPVKAPAAKGKAAPKDEVVERTRGFFEVGSILADVGALVSGRSSGLGVQAVEEAAVLRLPWAALRVACNADHALERWSRLLVEDAFLEAQARIASHALGGPRSGRGGGGELPVEVRYRAFLEERPMLAGRLQPWLVASYLGISTEALAQLRSRRFRTPDTQG